VTAAAVAAAAVAAAAVVAAAVVAAAIRLPPLRILVTDDAPSIVKVMKRFLEANGHTVETAENGNQALECLKARLDDFDLMITDLNMPVMDGYESVRRFREWEGVHGNVQQDGHDGQVRFPIIAMSANADEETLHDVLAVGMDSFIAKPFDYKSLVRELQSSTLMSRVMVRRDVVDVMRLDESAKVSAKEGEGVAWARKRGATRGSSEYQASGSGSRSTRGAVAGLGLGWG
jgi:CheY-like chemotaxis protein